MCPLRPTDPCPQSVGEDRGGRRFPRTAGDTDRYGPHGSGSAAPSGTPWRRDAQGAGAGLRVAESVRVLPRGQPLPCLPGLPGAPLRPRPAAYGPPRAPRWSPGGVRRSAGTPRPRRHVADLGVGNRAVPTQQGTGFPVAEVRLRPPVRAGRTGPPPPATRRPVIRQPPCGTGMLPPPSGIRGRAGNDAGERGRRTVSGGKPPRSGPEFGSLLPSRPPGRTFRRGCLSARCGGRY